MLDAGAPRHATRTRHRAQEKCVGSPTRSAKRRPRRSSVRDRRPSDLVPDREHEHDPDREEEEHHHREAQRRARLLALAPDARVAARAVVVVRAIDRSWIERRVFGRTLDAAERLGHQRILGCGGPGWPAVSPYFRWVGRWSRVHANGGRGSRRAVSTRLPSRRSALGTATSRSEALQIVAEAAARAADAEVVARAHRGRCPRAAEHGRRCDCIDRGRRRARGFVAVTRRPARERGVGPRPTSGGRAQCGRTSARAPRAAASVRVRRARCAGASS